MSEEKWTCPGCGAENTGSGKYCLTCGAPRFSNIGMTGMKNEPEEKLNFSELKQKRDPHGKLQSVSYSFSSNGMMMNSHEESEVTLRRLSDQEAELLIRHDSGMTGGSSDVYRIPLSLLLWIEKTADEENMAAWSRLRFVPDPRFMPTDYSSSSHLSLTYDSADPQKPRQEYFSIDLKALPAEGSAVVTEIVNRMRTAAEGQEPVSHTENPPKNGGIGSFFGMLIKPLKDNGGNTVSTSEEPELVLTEDGRWICPDCKEKNAGKFCSGCGRRMPGR